MAEKRNKEDSIIIQDFSEEMKNSYRDYAVSVIIARALPDVRDGLKPVQRRILYAMDELGLAPDKPHRKSARIVGDTMGKYHPHGDSSIYDALVHMSEDFTLSVPLVDGHGNFGSIDGDSAAAMRYTEARLSKGAMMLLEGLDKNLVEFIPNFDESEKEPVILPARIPVLLMNGTTGIAVGMATNIPPHNPAEVLDGTMALLDNPELTVRELMEYIPGPDFPTGGTIVNKSELENIYESGEGKIRVRGKVTTEKGEYGRTNIVVTEIPFTASGSKTRLVESIVALMKDRVFDEIYDVRDESSKEGIRIVIEVKKGRDVDNLLAGLYKKTGLEDTYSVNMLAVKDQQPIVFNLKSILQEFISFQKEMYTKEFTHLLEKALARQEVVEGLIRATDLIDLIIEVLRGSQSVRQAKNCLIHGDTTDIRFKSAASEKEAKKFDFTEVQADAILAMPLSRLIGLELLKLTEEAAELAKNIKRYRTILSKEKELLKEIRKALEEYRKVLAGDRKTELIDEENQVYVEEVKIEDLYVFIDRFGYTKVLDEGAYQKVTDEQKAEYPQIFSMKNTDKLCLFTAQGNMYQVKGMMIPRCRLKDKGTLLHNLSKVGREEIIAYIPFEKLFESMVFFATAKGFVKLVSGVEFDTNRSMVAATRLEDGDELRGLSVLSAAEVLSHKLRVLMVTKKKQSLGFLLDEVSEMKKTGRGVKGISLESGDEVLGAVAVMPTVKTIVVDGDTYDATKIRLKSRAGKPSKTKW